MLCQTPLVSLEWASWVDLLHHKDLGIALELARAHGVSLPVTALVDQMFASLEVRGRGDLDHCAC